MTRPKSTLVHLSTLVLALGLAACASTIPPKEQWRRFPDVLAQTTTADIQVVRDSTVISLTNTTASPLAPATLWLNRRFARHIPEFAVGQSLTLELDSFVDENGERFRAGGFFASEAPEKLVQAQLELPPSASSQQPQLVGLVVIAE
ncbi:MAG: hypothetical protein AB7Q00_01910 [Phycisphaerales bacterium]|nr:MAG: hypothetical protein IPK69_06530 [Phycisphaerales bacterium]